MKITVQVETIHELKEALNSQCEGIRFGAEFCEWKIPRLNQLHEAYDLTQHAEKQFTYITPRVSSQSLERLGEHLQALNNTQDTTVVINDLGVLNILSKYPNLTPQLGRQLIFIPARCPWPQITGIPTGFWTQRKIAKIFYQTSLNFEPTISFLSQYGIFGVDVDGIPECFPSFNFLTKSGIRLTVYAYLAPTTITRKCHMARFFNEPNPENCSRPCSTTAFHLKPKHQIVQADTQLFLQGNVVFKTVEAIQGNIRKLHDINIAEVVITVNPITKHKNREQIDTVISKITSG
ncbi:MAG: hypothetical protein JSV76_04110 [Candidatus Bathyarchaeota archaeon]|nr:MAG: hypothetical protein JSV76_04110 [Candidatus Bathyarchaeota archaeon]